MALKASSKEMSSSWFKSLKMLTLLNLVTPVMKTNCRYFLFAALMVFAVSGTAMAGSQDFTLINGTGQIIREIYLSPTHESDKIIAYFIQLNKYIKTSKPYHIWASRSFCAVGSGQKQVIGSWERLGGDGRRLVQETIKTVER